MKATAHPETREPFGGWSAYWRKCHLWLSPGMMGQDGGLSRRGPGLKGQGRLASFPDTERLWEWRRCPSGLLPKQSVTFKWANWHVRSWGLIPFCFTRQLPILAAALPGWMCPPFSRWESRKLSQDHIRTSRKTKLQRPLQDLTLLLTNLTVTLALLFHQLQPLWPGPSIPPNLFHFIPLISGLRLKVTCWRILSLESYPRLRIPLRTPTMLDTS